MTTVTNSQLKTLLENNATTTNNNFRSIKQALSTINTEIEGCQAQITSGNKLSADLVDDSSAAHKFVTSAEKTAIGEIGNKTTMSAVEAKGYQTAQNVTDAINTVISGISITAWNDIVINN